MITTQLSNSSPYLMNSGLAEILESITLPTFKAAPTNDTCPCDYIGLTECPSTVFADLTETDFWKNDKTSFLYRKLLVADTVVIKLFKNGVELATITDNTYGEYFASLPTQPLYVYFILNFENVAGVSGFGQYQIKTDVVKMGVSDTIESPVYQVEPYSDESADGTIRIETYQNGNIIGSEFDYTGLNIYQSYRIPGKLTVESAKEVDKYETQNYISEQIQDQVIKTWKITTELIDSKISDQLIDNDMLANTFQVTDYNLLNHKLYRRVELYPIAIPEDNSLEGNPNKTFVLEFSDKVPNIIKRNF